MVHAFARIESADKDDVDLVRRLPSLERIVVGVKTVDVDAVRNDAIRSAEIMFRTFLGGRRHGNARAETRHASRQRSSEDLLKAIASRHVERAHLRTLGRSDRKQRQARRSRAMCVDEIECVTAKQCLELTFQIPAHRVVDVRAVVRNQYVAANSLHSQPRIALAVEARSDHSHVVTAPDQFRRRRVHVFGNAAETRVIRLRDDADSHAVISRSSAAARSLDSAGSPQNERKMHH